MAEEKAKELVNSEVTRFPIGLFDVDKWFDESFLKLFAPFGLSRMRAATEEVVPVVDIFESNGTCFLRFANNLSARGVTSSSFFIVFAYHYASI